MSKQNHSLIALATLAVASPLSAQTAAEEAAEAAAEAVEEAAAEASDARNRDPAPVPVVQIPAPPPRVVPRVATYPREPRPVSIWNAFRPADYPASSWVANEEGAVEYSVTVTAEGTPSSCIVTTSSGYTALDNATCSIIMERVKFTPAYAAKDEPTEGVYVGSYTWRKREPNVPALSITYQYDQSVEGTPTNCKVIRMEGQLPERMRRDIERDMERNDGCLFGGRNRYGIPYRDENGNPIEKRVTFSMDVVVEDVPAQ